MLKWVFGADTGPFRSGVNQMRDEVKQFSSSAKSHLAGLFGGAALLAGAKSIMDKMDRIQKLALRFGESAESIQKVGAAADLAGLDIEGLAKAMTAGTRNAAEAAAGNENLAESFARLGINAEEFMNLPMEQKILALSAGYNDSASSAQGLADVMTILGKSGAEAIPLLTQTMEELQAQFDGAARASQGVVDKMAYLNDRLTEGQQTLSVWGANFIAFLTNISATWGLLWMAMFDLVSDGFTTLVNVASEAADVIGNSLKGDFAGAQQSAKNFFAATKGGFENLRRDIEKTNIAIAGQWKDNNGSSPAPKTRKTVADAEAAADANDAKTKVDSKEKPAKEAAAVKGSVKKDDGRLASAEERWGELMRQQKLDAMGDDDKLKFLKGERKESNLVAKGALKKGDKLGAIEAGEKSWKIQGEIDQVTRKKADEKAEADQSKMDLMARKRSEIDDMKSMDAKSGTITASSLADIGGGGGVALAKPDHSEQIAQGIQELVSLARAGNELAQPGPPEPVQ